MLLIDDLLALSVKGFFGIFTKIHEMADKELYSEDKIQEELLHTSQLYESEQITKEEYEKKEAALLERLTAVREAKSDPSTHSTDAQGRTEQGRSATGSGSS